MNVQLLEKISSHILEEPMRLSMEEWITEAPETCDSVACIAGWACLLGDQNYKPSHELHSSIRCDAGKLLKLTSTVAAGLFFVALWPKSFREAYAAAETPKERAEIAVKRIDHFIRTAGAWSWTPTND